MADARFLIAQDNRGRCKFCGEGIAKGDAYLSFVTSVGYHGQYNVGGGHVNCVIKNSDAKAVKKIMRPKLIKKVREQQFFEAV